MANLAWDTWLRLVIWLIIGFFIYFGYGIHNSRLNKQQTQSFNALKEEEETIEKKEEEEMVALEE